MKSKITHILILGLLCTSFVGNSTAANHVVKKKPAKVTKQHTASWEGLYIGALLGYGWNKAYWQNENSNWFGSCGPNDDQICGDSVISSQGTNAGADIGINYQFGHWLIGIEGSAVNVSLTNTSPIISNYPGLFDTSKVTWIATGKARIGYAFKNWLTYFSGGFAGGEIRLDRRDQTSIAPLIVSAYNTKQWQWKNSWVASIGVERKLTKKLSMGLEYEYVSLKFATQEFPCIGCEPSTTLYGPPTMSGKIYNQTINLTLKYFLFQNR